MFDWLKPKGNKSEAGNIKPASSSAPDVSGMSDAKRQLFAQLKAKREELGPEEIAKMQKAVEMQALQKKIKNDIDSDDTKRQRLLDEIRFQMKDK